MNNFLYNVHWEQNNNRKALQMKGLWRRIAVGILACLLSVGSLLYPVSAAVENGVIYPIESNEIAGWPQIGELKAETAVLLDADTGEVLVNKGMYNARYPASTTKIMTTLLALENSQLTDQVVFTEEGLARMLEGTHIDSRVGEILTMEQCLYAVMIVSANEVAAQVAIQVAGSEAAFAEMMNARAEALGCKNTHFTNASGLPDENHYTCAYDMALIMQEALKNETFRQIIETRNYSIPPTNMHEEQRDYTTHLPLVLSTDANYYEPCISGKTGVTQVAWNTLVTVAAKDGKTLIAVAMRTDLAGVCADSKTMYEYGFTGFQKLEVPGGSVMIPNGATLDELTTTSEDRNGVLVTHYYYGTKYVGTGDASEVTSEPEEAEEEEEKTVKKEKQTYSAEEPEVTNILLEKKGFAATAGALCGLVILGLILIIIRLISKIRRIH